jgi:hypothetical protein
MKEFFRVHDPRASVSAETEPRVVVESVVVKGGRRYLHISKSWEDDERIVALDGPFRYRIKIVGTQFVPANPLVRLLLAVMNRKRKEARRGDFNPVGQRGQELDS